MTVSGDAAQHRIHEAGRTGLSRPSRHRDGIVDGRRRRDAIEMNQLICADAQNLQDVEIELVQGPPGVFRNQVVELTLPSQSARDQVVG